MPYRHKGNHTYKLPQIHFQNFKKSFKNNTSSCALVKGFLKKNNSTEVLEGTRSGEEELTQSTPVWLNILYIDAGETLSNCAGWLIGRKDTLSRGSNVSSIGDELICRASKIK